jgi:hypothetical protein
MRKSLVSLVALGLFLGAPALANTAMAQTTTDKATTQQQTSAPSAEQSKQMLGEYEARTEIDGHIFRAMMPDGSRVLVLVGPRNLEPEQDVKANDNDIRSRFEEGGFSDVAILGGPRVFRADLDAEHYIFALTADEMLRFGVQTGALTGTDSEMGRDATELGKTDTETTVEMGQADTEMQMNPQAGTTTGQAGTGSETQLGQTGTGMQTETQAQDGQTGTETGTGTETQLGQTGTETGTGTETQLGQTGTETDTGTETQLGQTDTEMDTETETQLGQTGTGMQTETQAQDGQTGTQAGQIGRALSEPDADRIVSNLEEAGLQNAEEFQGRLVKAMTVTDRPMFFVITAKNMDSGGQVDINEDEVRQKLESAGLEKVEFIKDAKIVRGELEDDQVFVLAGDLFGQTGQQ